MHNCHLRGFARTSYESTKQQLSGCCTGPVDFVQSYGMPYESQNPLSGVTLLFFLKNLGEISDKHGESFHQGIMPMVDYCWTLKRDVPDAKYQ